MKYGDRITIVSLSYKNYDNIYDTISSILSQDYPNLSIILSDDGCDAFPQNDLERFIVSNKSDNIFEFTVRKNSQNVGTVKHENIVCGMVNSEYIIELSCGDVFYECDSVSKIVRKIEETNANIIAYRRAVCNSDGDTLYYLPHSRDINRINRMRHKEQYEALVSGQFYDMASGSAMAYKTSFICEEKFDEKYRLMEDYPLITKYTFQNEIECCYSVIGIKYALGGVSNTNNPLICEDIHVYNSTDRISHLDDVSFFTKEKIKYQLARASQANKAYLALRFPLVLLWLIKYKINQKIGVIQDRNEIKRSTRHK